MRYQESKDETESLMKFATTVMFTQISANAGVKKFGEKAVAAMVKECRQIYKGKMEEKPVVNTIDPDTVYFYDQKTSRSG